MSTKNISLTTIGQQLDIKSQSASNSDMLLAFWIVAVGLQATAVTAIEDPFNIFCGSNDCYDVLEITDKKASTKDIKKAYRRLSVIYHPDKNKSPEATIKFREIAKAVEVLEDEKTREDYDYYLAHPREYYKVTGKHYFRKLPDADIRLIVAGIVLFLSVLVPIVQYQRYQAAITYLRHATIHNLSQRNGGSKQTVELYQRAAAEYEDLLRQELGAKFDGKNIKMGKMQKDPKFIKIVEELVSQVQIEGGYRKPTIADVFAVWLILLPWKWFKHYQKAYKRRNATDTLTYEEKEEWAIERVTPAVWNDLSVDEQKDLIQKSIWEKEVYDKWHENIQNEEINKRPSAYKQYKRYLKKNPSS